MARLLDHIATPPRKPDALPSTEEKARIAPLESDHDDDENSSVPFIEIGGPDGRSKAPTARPARPAVIPMSRAEVKPVEAPKPLAPAPSYYRVSFQPLPTPRWSGLPQEKRLSAELVAYHEPHHAVSLQYQSILQAIDEQLSGIRARVILLCSLRPKAGTTSVLLNLAVSCAKQGHRVLALDADFAQPNLADRLGIAPGPGLRESLARTVPSTWALQETAEANLHAVAAGQSPAEPPLDLLPGLLDQFRHRFEWIFVDAGEWIQRPEKRALLMASTAAYLVLTPPDFEAPEADNLLSEIGVHGSKLRGYVLVQR
ncbi:MAG TPA: hypothetical protein VGZ47_19190 [Gemmataceae bacterium]|jgi:Mrp family chromosome partitioning ATPase|nr:hypothetical protein [Gemmataceae bacterium]